MSADKVRGASGRSSVGSGARLVTAGLKLDVAGALMLRRVNEKLLKLGVVAIGLAPTIGLFWTAP
jgi:hypothetical protein